MEKKTPLDQLGILALDCQATGANPDKGWLLEIGWVPGRADASADGADVRSYIIRQPTGIPPAVKRITGISEADLSHAVPEEVAWHHLASAAEQMTASNPSVPCPLVVHFARFEQPFLHRLHQIAAPGRLFPFEIICTHQIALRLLPELPRRGLRALAGYFGHAVPELKRSADHALATLSIWEHLVGLLQSRCGVHSLPALGQWLADTPPPCAIQRAFPMKADVRRLPDQPGIYRMRRASGGILYVGKAKSLRRRVTSYFRSNARHPEHILEMLTQALDLDFVPTASALEAAVLEADDIKRLRPPYNIALRPGGRNLTFFTKDLLRRDTHGDETFCIGPIPDGRSPALLAAFAHWVAHDLRFDDDIREYFDTAMAGSSSPPARECLQAALDLFRSTHQASLKTTSALRIVTSLGAVLWRRCMQTAQCEPPVDIPEEEVLPDETGSPSAAWTPADVVTRIEHMLMDTAHMLRRARWFLLLADAGLAWSAADEPLTMKHLLHFDRGKVLPWTDRCPHSNLPVPAGCVRSYRQRRLALDLATYDRLRVLTTELRRLVCEGRTIELHLSPKVCLNSEQLKQLLRWV